MSLLSHRKYTARGSTVIPIYKISVGVRRHTAITSGLRHSKDSSRQWAPNHWVQNLLVPAALRVQNQHIPWIHSIWKANNTVGNTHLTHKPFVAAKEGPCEGNGLRKSILSTETPCECPTTSSCKRFYWSELQQKLSKDLCSSYWSSTSIHGIKPVKCNLTQSIIINMQHYNEFPVLMSCV